LLGERPARRRHLPIETAELIRMPPVLRAVATPPAGALRVEVRESIDGIDAAALDRITSRSNVFFDLRWFRLIESVALRALVGGDVTVRYVVAWAGSTPVAICPVLITRSSEVHLFYSLEKFFFTPWWSSGLEKHAPGMASRARWARLAVSICRMLARVARAGVSGWMLAVSPLSHRAEVAVAPLGEELERAARDAVIRTLQDLATELGLPLCFLGLQHDSDALRDALARRGFDEVFLAYDNVLELTGGTFEDYLGRFKSDARRLLRREIRAASDAGVHFERTTSLAALGPVLDALYRSTSARYSDDFFRQPPEFWAALEKHVGDHVEAIVARGADGPTGFSLLLRKNDELWFHRVGRSYGSDTADAAVYFNLAFYEPVKRALEVGARRIWLGFGAWEAKRRRGAVARPIFSAFWFPRRWSRALLRPYLARFGEVSRGAMAHVLERSSYLKAEELPA
jgi:predicted N-acyltransferase